MIKENIKVIITLFALIIINVMSAKSPTNEQQTNSDKNSLAMVSEPDGSINGYGYVDLALPSGLKWATCNVGASKPEDYGSYFAWGETKDNINFLQRDCPAYGQDTNSLQANGFIDSYGNLTMAHDAARQNWGETWRLPTFNEVKELIENTTSVWTSINGIEGRLLKSKKNKKTIFLPAVGNFLNSKNDGQGSWGTYLTSTSCPDYIYLAWMLEFGKSRIAWDSEYRSHGYGARAVSR